MKYSAVVVLVLGLVASVLSASNGLNAALDKRVDEVVAAFEQGMTAAPALGDADSKEANELCLCDPPPLFSPPPGSRSTVT
jgi:hypothetical protein